MQYLLRLLVVFFAVTVVQTTVAQQDTVFWFAAPEISASVGDNPIHLRFLTYGNAATVTITQPANGGFATIVRNIAANSFDEVDLSLFLGSIESPAANVAADNGLKITSTANITAYYELGAANSKEIFSLKGSKGIGTNFYTPFQDFWDNGITAPASFSSIDIVATENGTTLLITPRTDVVGHVANVSYTVLLNAGQTYSARDVNTSAATTLSGSIVASDKPIAVTTYSGGLSSAGCNSTMGDQITTADFGGTEFIIHKTSAQDERIYILAIENNTTVTIDDLSTTSTLINWGETYEYVLTDDYNYIQTSKPVYLWHASGSGCSLGGAQVPPLFCAGTYNSAFSRASSDSLGLFLYTRTGFEGMFALNGNGALIPAGAFTNVPGTSGAFKMALIHYNTTDVPVGSYNEVTNTGDVFGVGVLNGENGTGVGYAYVSEFASYPFVSAGLDDTVCANVPFALNGVVGGGSVTGFWGGTGFGTFQNGSSALLNNYIPSTLDTIVSPINLILTSSGPCPVRKDTLVLWITPAPIVNANADQTVCANNAVVQLNGTVEGGTSTGIWISLGGGVFSPNDSTLNGNYIPSPSDTIAGTVTLVLSSTNAGSCNGVTDTMVVTITGSPFVDAGADTVTVCANNAFAGLTGQVNGATTTGKWSTAGNGLFSPNNLALNTTYEPSPQDIAAGSIMLYLESTNNGNCSLGIDSILVLFTAAPTVEAGVSIIACANEASIVLGGAVGGPTTSGVWTGGNGVFAPNDTDLNAGYTPTAAEIATGSMLLTLTSTNNGTCISVNDQVLISFVASPFANFSFTEVCLNDSTTFADFSLPGFGSIATWAWDFDDTNTSAARDNMHLYMQSGSFDVELVVTTNVGCSDTSVQTINVFELPVSSFNYGAQCSGSQVVVNFTDSSYSGNDAINSWYYDFGGQGAQSVQNPSQLFVGDGNFIITQIVTTVNGCVDTTIQTINLPPRPVAGFYYNSSNGLNIGAEFSFYDTSQNAIAWNWIFDDGNFSAAQDPVNIYFSNGTYVVTQYVTGELGCIDSISQTIVINTVVSEVNTLIPNAISPNNDGKNDVWKLDFINLLYPEATVQVFNRWGQELFYSVGYDLPWSGRFEGEPVPDGTYYYVINLNDASEPEPFKGAILVLKHGQ
jgi:gliding motility-associated-like protein